MVRDSILNTSQYFYVVDGLVPDIMHDILEGALQLQINLLIRQLINSSYFSLKVLNSRIGSFSYGPVDVGNQPTPLPDKALGTPDRMLKQSGKVYFAVNYC